MKVIHFADVHLGMENYGKFDSETGLNSRLGDFLKSFEHLVTTAKKENVDLVCFAGDAYKTRDPSPTYQRAFAQKIYEIAAAGIPVVLLVGNHDFPNALGKAHTLDIYETLNVPNVSVLGTTDVIKVETKSGPIQIGGLPWFTKNQLLGKDDARLPFGKIQEKLSETLAQKIMELSKKIDRTIPSILLTHATVEGAVFGSERMVMIGSDVLVPLRALRQSSFNYVALGHLHKFQVLNQNPPVIYAGSIERVDFGEEKEDKGFVLIDFQAKNQKIQADWRFIKTPARPFLSIKVKVPDSEENPTEKIIQEVGKNQLREKVVKLIIEISEEKQSELNEAQIREALASANFIAGIVKEISSYQRIQIKNGFSDELQSLDTLGILEKYLSSKNVSTNHQKDLIKIAEHLIEEAL